MFSDNLGELYDMQRMVGEQMDKGMGLVLVGIDEQQLTADKLHFFRDLLDMAVRGVEENIPMEGAMARIGDFMQVLNSAVHLAEEKLEKPLDNLIQEINIGLQMTPESQDKFYANVFKQDVQEQMGHDLGNIYTHLLKEREDGKEWVAYPDIEKVGKEDLRAFDTKEEARDFVMEKSNVAVVYDFNPIGSITDALEPLVEAKLDKHFDQNNDQDKGSDKDNDKDKGKDKGRDEEMEM